MYSTPQLCVFVHVHTCAYSFHKPSAGNHLDPHSPDGQQRSSSSAQRRLPSCSPRADRRERVYEAQGLFYMFRLDKQQVIDATRAVSAAPPFGFLPARSACTHPPSTATLGGQRRAPQRSLMRARMPCACLALLPSPEARRFLLSAPPPRWGNAVRRINCFLSFACRALPSASKGPPSLPPSLPPCRPFTGQRCALHQPLLRAKLLHMGAGRHVHRCEGGQAGASKQLHRACPAAGRVGWPQ